MCFWSISCSGCERALSTDVKSGSQQKDVDSCFYEFLGFPVFSYNTDASESA